MNTYTKQLRIAQLKIDTTFQVRAALNLETITEYAEAMKAGANFPPVKVVNHNGTYILADGFHRVEAARQAGKDIILAEIVDGDESTALEIAVKGNRQHGLRMTSADKRRAIKMVLKQWLDKSNREIARLVGCTDPTVAAVKQSMQKFSNPAPSAAPLSPDEQARLEQDLAALNNQTPEVRDCILTTHEALLEADEGCWLFYFFAILVAIRSGKILSAADVEEAASFADECSFEVWRAWNNRWEII